MKQQLTQGCVGSQLSRLTLPIVWRIFAVIVFNLVDTYFVGQLKTNELAALSFTFPVIIVLGNVAMGLGIGASSAIACAISKGDRVYISGRTNRAQVTFKRELLDILEGLKSQNQK